MVQKSSPLTLSVVAFVALALFAFTSPIAAQTKSKSAASKKESSSSKATSKSSSEKTAKKEAVSEQDKKKAKIRKELAETSGRLPNFFGQLKLKDEQILEIYQLQNEYQKEIDALEKKIADLKAKMKSGAEKVLTTSQRSSLKKLRGETSSKSTTPKRSSSRKKSTSKK